MLNYIGAECYKLCHKKAFFVGMTLLLSGESLVFLSMFNENNQRLEWSCLFLVMMLPVGLLLAPIFAALTFDDQYRYGTMKNEVIFGIPRSRIYLGKLSAAIMVGTAAGAVAVGWYLLLSQIICKSEAGEADGLLQFALQTSINAFPLWIAALSFTFLLLMLLHNASGAIAVSYLICIAGTPVALMGCDSDAPLALRLFDTLFYAAPFRVLYANGADTAFHISTGGSSELYCWALGLGWAVVTTVIGMAAFRKREIR